MNSLANFLLFLALALSPLYVFPSGTPQPGDLVFCVFTMLVLGNLFFRGDKLPFGAMLLAWFLFVGWIVLVTVAWSLLLQSATVIQNALFYIFNFVVGVALIAHLATRRANTRVLRAGISTGLVVSGLGLALSLSVGSRETGLFNNPNQLAYYSICAMALQLVLYDFRIPLKVLPIAATLSAIAGVAAAASLAGMGGMVFLLVAVFLANAQNVRRFVQSGFIVITVGALLYSSEISFIENISDNVTHRLSLAERKVGSAYSERNYDRIAAFPGYIFLGAGEGEIDRFRGYESGEIHSSFANTLFCYGLPGLFLFLCILFFSLKTSPYYVVVLSLAPLVYSMTHMGMRATVFWILLSVVWFRYGSYGKSVRQYAG